MLGIIPAYHGIYTEGIHMVKRCEEDKRIHNCRIHATTRPPGGAAREASKAARPTPKGDGRKKSKRVLPIWNPDLHQWENRRKVDSERRIGIWVV